MTPSRSEILYVMSMPYGKIRRTRLLSYITTCESKCLYVNCKYQLQIKQDPDLRYLIKKGKLKQDRVSRGWGNKTNQTILVLVEDAMSLPNAV